MKENITSELASHIRNKLMVPMMRMQVASAKIKKSIDEANVMLEQSLSEMQTLTKTIKDDFDKLMHENKQEEKK